MAQRSSVRRIASACAALALVAGSLLAGASAASAAPIAPSINGPAGGTTDRTPDISGTVESGFAQTIEVMVQAGPYDPALYCSVEIDYTEAAWACPTSGLPELDYGSARFTARTGAVPAVDGDPVDWSPYSEPLDLLISGDQPATLTAPAAGTTTHDATPGFSGTGPTFGGVDVYVDSVLVCFDSPDYFGAWYCDATAPLALGSHQVAVVGRTPDVTQPATAPTSLTIVAPPTVDTYAPAWITDLTLPEMRGSNADGDTRVEVSYSADGVNYADYCSVDLAGSTIWFCDAYAPGVELAPGDYFFAAQATNAFETSDLGTPITVTVVPPPTVDSPLEFTNDPQPTFSGTGTGPAATVWNLDDGETEYCNDPETVAGAWSCTYGGTLDDGVYAFSVDLSSSADGIQHSSTSSTFTVDTVAPGVPDITAPAGPTASTTTPTPTVSGTGETAAVVVVYVNGVAVECAAPAVVVDGAWTCTLLQPLAEGDYELAARQTDRAGNTTGGVLAAQVVLTVEPDGAFFDPPLNGGTAYGDSYEVSGAANGDYDEVVITDSRGGAAQVAAVVDGTWTATLTGLDTTETLTVSVAPSASSAVGAVTDSVTLSVLLPPTVDGVLGNTLTATTHTPVITGTALPSLPGKSTWVEVRVYTEAALFSYCEAPVDTTGAWSCAYDDGLATGSYPLEVRQVPYWSVEGRPVSTPAYDPLTLVIDSEMPLIQCSFAPGGVEVTGSDAEVSFYQAHSGAGEGGALTEGGCPSAGTIPATPLTYDYHGYCSPTGSGEAYFGSVGAGTCSVSDLAPGLWNVYFSHADGGTYYDYFFTVPSPPTGFRLEAGTFYGYAQPGNEVVVTGDGETVCSNIANTDGTWFCSPDGTTADALIEAFQIDAVSGGVSPVATLGEAPSLSLFDQQASYTIDQGESLALEGQIAGTLPAAPALSAQMVVGDEVVAWDCTTDTATGSWSCALPTAPTRSGLYTLTLTGSGAGGAFDVVSAIPVLVLGAPGLDAGGRTALQDSTFSLGGTKISGQTVHVQLIDAAEITVFSAQCADASDAPIWACDFTLAGSGVQPGTYGLAISQTYPDSGGEFSGFAVAGDSPVILPLPTFVVTAAEIIPVVPPASPLPEVTPTPGPTATPVPVAAPKVPLTWRLTITGVDGPLRPGQKVGLSSSGIPAGSIVEAELHSTPIPLGSSVVKADGTFDYTVTIPKNVEPGDHKIVVTVTAPGEDPSPVANPVQIVIDPDDEKVFAGELDHQVFFHEAESVTGNPRNDPNSPTGITGGLPTLAEILSNPLTLCFAAALALALMLLVALPSEILNSTLESNSGRFGRFFGAVQGAIDGAAAWFVRVTRTPVVTAVLLVLITATIFGFIDPDFGVDLASIRLVLSLALGLLIITVGASSLTALVVERRWSIRSEISMQPALLLFAALGVVIARLLEFSPGFLVGLVIGLELAAQATDRQRIRASAVKASFIIGLSVLAWLVYSVWVALQGETDLGFWGGLLQDALVAVTAEGLTGVTIALIPIAFTDGKKLFAESKRMWAVLFLVSATAFSLLVLPTALAGQEVGDIVTWAVVLVVFAIIVFGVTLWLKRTGRTTSAESPAREKANH